MTTEDRYLPGTLNPEAMKISADHYEFPASTDNTDFFPRFHESILKGAAPDSFKGVSRYKGMVISQPTKEVVGGGWFKKGKPRYSFRVRIPELHSAIQDPCSIAPDGGTGANLEDSQRKLVCMHPMAITANDNENGDTLPEPSLGDIVWIEFEKGPSGGRMGSPIYVGRFSKGAGTNGLSDACSSLANLNWDGSTLGGNGYAPAGGYPGDPSSWPVSEGAQHITDEAAEDLHEVARTYYEEHGFDWRTNPSELNIMGMRNTNTQTNNSFDDKMICMYTDDAGAQYVDVWPCTTRPGRSSMTGAGGYGIAILIPSAAQYHSDDPSLHPDSRKIPSAGQKSYDLGRGGSNKEERGRPDRSDPGQAYRDSNNDDVFNYDPNTIGGCIQCQLHDTSPGRSMSKGVDGYSEGCQVWGQYEDFQFFLSLWKKQIAVGVSDLDYVLINAEDLSELWSTTTSSTATDEPQAGDPVE